ncbi:MAG: PilZ domain-containing protein [Kofleriaceae bacterium]|nr:MAG: PilZ domain-containing protein [Kofleriaceae bacterium]
MSQFAQHSVTVEREHPRYAIGTEVTLRTRAGIIARGRTTNLSRGGLCADLDAEPTRGQQLDVLIALIFSAEGVSEPLSLPARVVWCTGLGDHYQVGLSFLPMSKDQTAFLDMFIRFLREHPDDVSDEKSASRSLPFDLSR